MKSSKLPRLVLLAATLMAAISLPAFVVIDTVAVNNAGNAADPDTGFGAVSYSYYITTYEVTNAQYTAFLNTVAASDPYGLWSSTMGSSGGIQRSGSPGAYVYTIVAGKENMPVSVVSFWDAARFSNWMTTGNTESGVYNLGGNPTPPNTIERDLAVFNAGGIAVASEDEWYKAAYYDPTKDGPLGGYWLYPNQSNTAPSAATPALDPSGANYANAVGDIVSVGSYALTFSYYGTYDQGGNVWEWTDAIADTGRVRRGGAFNSPAADLSKLNRTTACQECQDYFTGFRLTRLEPIPEPSTYAAILGGLGLLFALWRRRR